MFIDEVTITVHAGDGGDGMVAFRRERFIPKGGPYGGNGGRGGNVYIEAGEDIGMLRRYQNQKVWKAENGGKGGIAKREGAKGKDLILLVPVGTIVTDKTDGKLYDFSRIGERILVAKGGKGGRGNREFASATNQTPRYAEKGEKGKSIALTFELRLIAHVGLIGLPNAGKTSLLNTLTHARGKVGDYPFTTLEPHLGAFHNLILADIPGLIEGASRGKGLGIKFLRHIARTPILLHCISSESEDLTRDYHIVRNELSEYNKELIKKREIILLTKTDLREEKEVQKMLKTLKKTKKEIFPVSLIDEKKMEKLRTFLSSLA